MLMAVYYSADGDVVAAFRYEKSFIVDRTSSRTVTNCVHRCWAVVYCQPTHIYCTWQFFLHVTRIFERVLWGS